MRLGALHSAPWRGVIADCVGSATLLLAQKGQPAVLLSVAPARNGDKATCTELGMLLVRPERC